VLLLLQGFAAPTPIQEACLMPAIQGRRDIIGAAQTVRKKQGDMPTSGSSLLCAQWRAVARLAA